MDDMCQILLPLLIKVVPQIIIFVKLKLTNILRWDISPTPSNLNLWTDNPTGRVAGIQYRLVPATCCKNSIDSGILARIDRRQHSLPLLDDTSE